MQFFVDEYTSLCWVGSQSLDSTRHIVLYYIRFLYELGEVHC